MAMNAMKALSSKPLLTGLGLGLLTVFLTGIKIMKKKSLPNLGVVPTRVKGKAWMGDAYRSEGEWRWLRKKRT
jgi:hypothetical protein